MRSRLESIKPLDSNVEKDGVKEIKYDKDSYDYLFNEDELFMLEQSQLRDEDGYYEDSKNSHQEIADMIAESAISGGQLKELWNASSLGKYTINTPMADKQQESRASKEMKIFDEKEIKKALDEFNRGVNDGDPIKEETNAEIDSIINQMELDW